MNNDFPTDGPNSIAEVKKRPSEVADRCDCSASLQVVKQLTDMMHHHIQEANRYALELRKYAIPKLEHELQTPNDKAQISSEAR